MRQPASESALGFGNEELGWMLNALSHAVFLGAAWRDYRRHPRAHTTNPDMQFANHIEELWS